MGCKDLSSFFSNSRFDTESFLLSICFFQALRVESKTSDISPEKKRFHAKFNLSSTPSRQKVTYCKSEKNCEQKNQKCSASELDKSSKNQSSKIILIKLSDTRQAF